MIYCTFVLDLRCFGKTTQKAIEETNCRGIYQLMEANGKFKKQRMKSIARLKEEK